MMLIPAPLVGHHRHKTIFKLNVDAVVANRDMGYDMIIRNSKCKTMAVVENFRRTSCLVERVEAQTLIDGVHLALESSISPVWAEVDSKIIWSLLHDRDHHFNEIVPLIYQLKLLSTGQHTNLSRRKQSDSQHTRTRNVSHKCSSDFYFKFLVF